MTIPTHNDYEKIAVEIGKKLERNLGDNFVSFFIIGSMSRGDLAPGWSDFDSVLVVRENNEEVGNSATSLSEEITERYPFFQSDRGSFVSIYSLALDDIINSRIAQNDFPSALNFYDFKFNSRVIIGEDLSVRINVPKITERDIDMILSQNYESLMKQNDSNAYWQGRNAIAFSLNIARLLLIRKGIFVSKKRDIVDEFQKLYPEERKFLEEIAWSRENWNEINDNDSFLKALYEKASCFVNKYVP